MTSANRQPTKLGYSIREACQVTSLGRTKLYALIGAGRLGVTRVGGRTIVHADSLNALLAEGE